MKSQLYAAGVVLALAVSLVGARASHAKPADLPSPNGIECPDGSDDPMPGRFSIELDITSRGITLKVGAAAAAPETPLVIDPLMPAFVEQCLQHLGDMLARPERFVGVDALLGKLPRLGSAAAFEPSTPECPVRSPLVTLVEARLFEPVKVRIKDVPLKQALKNLAFASGVKIVPDATLKKALVDMDAPVSLTIENTSLHTALQQILNPARLTFKVEGEIVKVSVAGADGARTKAGRDALQAQRLFEVGERCRRAGDYEKSRACFQQVHLLTPTTLHGRMAIVRLEEIEERMRDTSEEQGGPARTDDPEQVFRDMRDRTVPLGLVEVSY